MSSTHAEIAEWLAVELARGPVELIAHILPRDEEVMAFAFDVRWSDTSLWGFVVMGAGPGRQPWPDVYRREPRK